jgi:hypothetical protein
MMILDLAGKIFFIVGAIYLFVVAIISMAIMILAFYRVIKKWGEK